METSETASEGSTITAWTLIVRARATGPEATRALGELLQKFRPFIVWCIAELRPPPDTSTDDLFQEFTVGFIRRHEVDRLNRCGSLRGWLKSAIRNFLFNEWDLWRRRQHLVYVSTERSASITESQIDGAYLGTVVMHALELARSRSPDPGRFEKLSRFLPGPQSDFVPYAEVSAWLDISEGAARAAVHAERLRYERCLDEIVLQTVDVGDDAGNPQLVRQRVEEEKRELLRGLDPPSEVVTLDPDRDPA